MRKACRDFLDTEQTLDGSTGETHQLFQALSQLRRIFAIEIGKLSVQYGIDLDAGLALLVTRFTG
jgi:hypothetical protein